MKELINANDKYKMNWIEGNTEWGTVKCPKGISVKKNFLSIRRYNHRAIHVHEHHRQGHFYVTERYFDIHTF